MPEWVPSINFCRFTFQLLKGRHMMVRVGGGWDTLEHFLLRHDPCQVRIMNRNSTPSSNTTPKKHDMYGSTGFGSLSNLQTLTHIPTAAQSNAFLHIRAKYRSPPPPWEQEVAWFRLGHKPAIPVKWICTKEKYLFIVPIMKNVWASTAELMILAQGHKY